MPHTPSPTGTGSSTVYLVPLLSTTNLSAQLVNDTFLFDDEEALPVRGGWGYTRDDACIIDGTPAYKPGEPPFDGVGTEYAFFARRLVLELDLCSSGGPRHVEVNWRLIRQNTEVAEGRRYDRLSFRVSAIPERVAATLDEKELNAARMTADIECWFDITSFFPVRDLEGNTG